MNSVGFHDISLLIIPITNMLKFVYVTVCVMELCYMLIVA